MAINEIKQGDLVLARHVAADTAWSGGLKFFSPEHDYIQVGTWDYDSGKDLLAHSHNPVIREVPWTQEVLYVRKGRIRADIYSTDDEKVAELIVNEGDFIILLRGGHGYHILEDGTQVLEIKNGPYLGANTDRRRL